MNLFCCRIQRGELTNQAVVHDGAGTLPKQTLMLLTKESCRCTASCEHETALQCGQQQRCSCQPHAACLDHIAGISRKGHGNGCIVLSFLRLKHWDWARSATEGIPWLKSPNKLTVLAMFWALQLWILLVAAATSASKRASLLMLSLDSAQQLLLSACRGAAGGMTAPRLLTLNKGDSMSQHCGESSTGTQEGSTARKFIKSQQTT